MTEPIKRIKSSETKRSRLLNSTQTQEVIKKRLNQIGKSQLIYTGSIDEDLVAVRNKLNCPENMNLQIRGNKIFQIRKREQKLSIICKTIKQTITLMHNKNIFSSNSWCDKNIDEIYLIVYNLFFGGSEKPTFTVEN